MLSDPARQCIQKADVIIMLKCCTNFDYHALMMKDVTSLMEKGAVLFSIDSNAKNRIFLHLQGIGTSLCSSIKVRLENLPYDARLASFVGLPPKTKGSLNLVVWQKRVSTLTSTKTAEVEFKNETQSQRLDKQANSCSLKCSSDDSLTSEHSTKLTEVEVKNEIQSQEFVKQVNSCGLNCSSEDSLTYEHSTKLTEGELKNESQSQELDQQVNSCGLKSDSENSLISSSGIPMNLLAQKLDLNAVRLSNSDELFSASKCSSEIVENTIHESNSSDFKDVSNSISKISSEITVNKSSESNVLSEIEDSKCNVDSNNVPQSDKGCEIDLMFDSYESEESKINAMLEHCEKIVDCLEKRIVDITMQLHSFKNVLHNCCTHNNNHMCHISGLALYQKCAHFNASVQDCCHQSNCCCQELFSNAEAED